MALTASRFLRASSLMMSSKAWSSLMICADELVDMMVGYTKLSVLRDDSLNDFFNITVDDSNLRICPCLIDGILKFDEFTFKAGL